MNVSSTAFNTKLIDEVAQHSSIYDGSHPLHKDRLHLDTIWQSIADDMETTVEKCQTRWRTLRTAYGKRHKRRMEILSDPASIAQESWKYYDQLSFLDNCIKHRGYEDYFSESPSLCTFSEFFKKSVVSGQERVQKRACDFDDSLHKVKEIKSELQTTPKEGEKLVELRNLDVSRCESFGRFVSSELLSKPRHLLPHYMKEITKVLCDDVTEEANVTEAEDLNNIIDSV